MNKAFVREVDATYERCPLCSGIGIAVDPDTVAAWIKPECPIPLRDGVHFCPVATCNVVYFDSLERCLLQRDVIRPVYPKDPSAPVCGCFGFQLSEVEDDLAEGTLERTRAHVQRAKGPEARCRTMSPNGQCCIEDVQRYYFKHRPPE